MEIGYYREFVILAETQNFWEAAERLYMNESTLSKHIKNMEKQLGAPLFKRTSRKVVLTEFGEQILPQAQEIAKMQEECDTTAYNYIHNENAVLEFASIPDIAHYKITNVLLHFRQDFPNIQVNMQEEDTQEIRDMLIDHRCELSFYRDSEIYLEHNPEKEKQLEKIPYTKDRLVAVLPPQHPLAQNKTLNLSQLAGENFALPHPDTLPYEVSMAACSDAGFVPNVIFSSRNLEAILDMARMGGCVALLFEHLVNFPHNINFRDDLPFIPVLISPEISTTVCLAYRKNDTLSPAAQHFIEYYKNYSETEMSKS